MTGAHLKALVEGAATIGEVIDHAANNGCPASSLITAEAQRKLAQ